MSLGWPSAGLACVFFAAATHSAKSGGFGTVAFGAPLDFAATASQWS